MDKKSHSRYQQEIVLTQARLLRTIIKVLSLIPASVLGVHKLVSERFVALTTHVPAEFILNLCMVVHFASLTTGANRDTDIMEKIVLRPTKRGVFTVSNLGFALLLATTFTFLWMASGFTWFSLFLLAFWTANFASWHHLSHRILPAIISESRGVYESKKQYGLVERVAIVERYFCGRWQLVRFGSGCCIILLMLVMAVSSFHARFLPPAIAPDFASAMLVVIFLVSMLGWMWIMRKKTEVALDTIEELESRYDVRKRRSPSGLATDQPEE